MYPIWDAFAALNWGSKSWSIWRINRRKTALWSSCDVWYLARLPGKSLAPTLNGSRSSPSILWAPRKGWRGGKCWGCGHWKGRWQQMLSAWGRQIDHQCLPVSPKSCRLLSDKLLFKSPLGTQSCKPANRRLYWGLHNLSQRGTTLFQELKRIRLWSTPQIRAPAFGVG